MSQFSDFFEYIVLISISYNLTWDLFSFKAFLLFLIKMEYTVMQLAKYPSAC